jgi:hypothetical protein
VDAARIDPDGDRAPGHAAVQRDRLAPGSDLDAAAGGYSCLELDRCLRDGRVSWWFDHADGQRFVGRIRGGFHGCGGLETCGPVGAEQRRRCGHVEGLVRPAVVVGIDPPVDCVLGRVDRLERRDVIEELGAQRFVEALDLPGCGR